jgi:hypothetical protein
MISWHILRRDRSLTTATGMHPVAVRTQAATHQTRAARRECPCHSRPPLKSASSQIVQIVKEPTNN